MDNLNNPFLRGWNTSEVLSNQRGAHQLAALSGLMQLQAGMEHMQMAPLRRQMLETELANAQRNSQLRQMLMGGGNGSPQLAFGEGGVSMPGGAQGNVNTGQVVNAPQSQGFGGIDNNVAMLLLSGDPGLKALGTAILEQNKPVPMAEGGAIYRNGQIVASRPKLGENILPVTDARGNVTGVQPMPGATDVISGVTRATEGPKMGEFQIGGRTYKMPNEDYAAITGPDALKAVQTATRYGIPLSRDAGPQGAPQLPSGAQQGGIGTIPTARLFGSQTPAERTASEVGAKTQAENEAQKPQATLALQNGINNLDRLASEASAIISGPGLGGITGLYGKAPDIPGSAAANTRARLETLKSQVGFNVLQAMRDASKTGGALGNVSEKELTYLQNALASLDTSQSEDAFKRSLRQIVQYTQDAKQRLNQAFQSTYGGTQTQQGAPGDVFKAADAILNGNR